MSNEMNCVNRGPFSLADLKQACPGLYAECVALGVQRERQRILATLPARPTNPRERFAYDCIRDGSPLSETAKAKYFAMTMEAARKERANAQILAAIERRMGLNDEP